MTAWQILTQLLVAGGVGAFATALIQAIPSLRKAGAERAGALAGADKTRAELQLEVLEASREQVAFLRAEIGAMRSEFASSREEMTRELGAARAENEELTRELVGTRAEVTTLRGVVSQLHADLDSARDRLGG